MKNRSEQIQARIKELKDEINDLERELVLVRKTEKEKKVIFRSLPIRVQNCCGNYDTLIDYLCGKLENPQIHVSGVSAIHYQKARTPYQRLMAIHAVGESTTLETLRILGLD